MTFISVGAKIYPQYINYYERRNLSLKEDFMGFVKAMDSLPLWAKIIFALPFLDIVWAIYRIVKGVCKDDIIRIVVGVVWIVAGATICWVLDIVCLLLGRNVFFG